MTLLLLLLFKGNLYEYLKCFTKKNFHFVTKNKKAIDKNKNKNHSLSIFVFFYYYFTFLLYPNVQYHNNHHGSSSSVWCCVLIINDLDFFFSFEKYAANLIFYVRFSESYGVCVYICLQKTKLI